MKYYDHLCECGCKGRIPVLESHKKNGIPITLRGHHTKEWREEHSKRMTGKNNPNVGGKYCHGFEVGREVSEETKNKQSKARIKYYLAHPEVKEQLIIQGKASGFIRSGKDNVNYGKFGEDHHCYIDGLGIERRDHKRRGLGNNFLNNKTKIANSPHHINKEEVIWIPRKIHEKFWHSVKTGKNMKKINKLAFAWLEDHGIELQRSLLSFGDI